MKRREFVQKLGVGSAATALGASGALANTPAIPKATSRERQDHDHGPVKGPLATAIVSFGQWRTDLPVPLDRYPPQPPIPPPPPGNGHLVIPHEVTIKLGGTVNFIIAGFHEVIVYAPGTNPEDIRTALTRPTQGTPAGVPLIDDPNNRLYAGEDPSTVHVSQPPPPTSTIPLLDRVEVVQFSQTGRHLVICGVLPHFVNDQMYGWVKVVGDDEQ